MDVFAALPGERLTEFVAHSGDELGGLVAERGEPFRGFGGFVADVGGVHDGSLTEKIFFLLDRLVER